MVRAVQVDTVPTAGGVSYRKHQLGSVHLRGESYSCHDAVLAWFAGEIEDLGVTGDWLLQTGESQLPEPLGLLL